MSKIKKRVKIIILLIVFIFAFCLARDFIIKSIISTVVSNVTGTTTHIGGFSLSLIRQKIKITNFKIYNPKEFPDNILLDIPKIEIVWDLGPFIKGKIHLKKIDLELKELIIVKNKEGKLNIGSLKITEDNEPVATKKEIEKTKKEMPIQIDLMNLTIGRIVSKDYSVEGKPTVKVYDINLNKTYKNINSVQQLAILIISEPLKSAGIQGLKIYAVSFLTGVGVLPVAATLTFTGKDYARATFNVTIDKAYEVGLQVLREMGTVKTEKRIKGIINAEVGGARVTVKLKKVDDKNTEITVSARKLGLPQPEVASGVMYKITEMLK